MSLLAQLSTQLLIGSERRAVQIPQASGDLAELLQQLSADNSPTETQLLRAAGALAFYSQAGFQPLQAQFELPPACADETLPILPDERLAEVLQQLIQTGPQRLLREVVNAIAQYQYLVPVKMLPALLTLGKSHPQLAPQILALCGKRGVWLAQANDDWHYLLNQEQIIDKALWEHGQQEQRLLFIKHLRMSDPALARQLLAEALPESDARTRSALLETLHGTLQADDEAFLTSLLTDRSREVRNSLTALLSTLPQGHYVERMQTRMHACLSRERKLFRQHWQLSAPETFSSDWAADAIEEKRPSGEALGQKAWWLFQLARPLPLIWWQETLGLNPEQLIDWARAGDWSLALLRAWHQALVREKNGDWAEAFLLKTPFPDLDVDTLQLICLLPQEEAEGCWLSIFDGPGADHRRGEFLNRIVQQDMPPSKKFARAIIKNIKKHLPDESSKWDYALRQALVDFACLIPADCFADASQGWHLEDSNSQFFSETLARVLSTIEQRQRLIQFLTSQSL
ncbi:MAG TPA: DUF5691 domain-containing protein [Cellvibrio sp.]|nr:DUF5691 domain-containing protein [Cellvibrio sp.]